MLKGGVWDWQDLTAVMLTYRGIAKGKRQIKSKVKYKLAKI